MDFHETPPRALEGSSLGVPLERLHLIYGRIEEAQAKWIAASPYRCPAGCGACCEGFEPDVLEIEALYLAAFLLRTDPARFATLPGGFGEAENRADCALARLSGAYRCTAYGGRPLVCRLFAFSGDRAKDGTARFRLCSRMPAEGPRRLDEAGLRSRFGLLPPIMADFASEAECLLPSGAGKRAPLRAALPRAAAKVRYLADLAAFSAVRAAEDGGGDNDNPGGGSPPMPRAG